MEHLGLGYWKKKGGPLLPEAVIESGVILGARVQMAENKFGVYLRSTPHPVTVTTRIITFLVGNPELNLHLSLLLGGG